MKVNCIFLQTEAVVVGAGLEGDGYNHTIKSLNRHFLDIFLFFIFFIQGEETKNRQISSSVYLDLKNLRSENVYLPYETLKTF